MTVRQLAVTLFLATFATHAIHADDPDRIVISVHASPEVAKLLKNEAGRLSIKGVGENQFLRPYVVEVNSSGAQSKEVKGDAPYIALDFGRVAYEVNRMDSWRLDHPTESNDYAVQATIWCRLNMVNPRSKFRSKPNEQEFPVFASIRTGVSGRPAKTDDVLTDSVKDAALANVLKRFDLREYLRAELVGEMSLKHDGSQLIAKVPVGNSWPFRVKGRIEFPVMSFHGRPNYVVDPTGYDFDWQPGTSTTLTFRIAAKEPGEKPVLDWWGKPYRLRTRWYKFPELTLLPATNVKKD